MQNFNYHSHTERCGHAVGSDEAYVKEMHILGYEFGTRIVTVMHRESVCGWKSLQTM